MFLQPQGVYNRGNKGVNESAKEISAVGEPYVAESPARSRKRNLHRIIHDLNRKKIGRCENHPQPHSRRAGCDGSSRDESN